MKNLLIVLFLTISNLVFSQVEYPCMKVDSLGNKIVIMTLEQAQDLDNKTDLIPLLEKINTQSSQVDSSCVKNLADKDKIIDSQQKQIVNQKDLVSNKNKEIDNLNQQINNFNKVEENYKQEIDNKNKEIDLHLGQINKLKGKILIGGGVGVVLGLVAGFIISH